MTSATWLSNTNGKSEASAGAAAVLRVIQDGQSKKLTVASSLVGYLQGGGANVATPEDFGAAGNGSTNDTTALQNAIDSGKSIRLTRGKTYLHTSELVFSDPAISNNQYFGGEGVLKTSGGINTVKVTGGVNGLVLDLTCNSPGQSSGYAVYVSNASRIRLVKLNGIDVFGAVYAETVNTMTIDWLWSYCRGPGIKWYGNVSKRSDALAIGFALLTVPDEQYGFDWDGNCNTCKVNYLGIACTGSGTVSASNGNGIIIRNTSGGPDPAIGRFAHVEVDYSGTHGVQVLAGSDYDFLTPYILGSSGSGIYVGSSVGNGAVRIQGGKSVGNTAYGIRTDGGAVYRDASVLLASNSSGDVYPVGGAYGVHGRAIFGQDAEFYLDVSSGNPLIAFDGNDYISYDRANNALNAAIGTFGVVTSTQANALALSDAVNIPVGTSTGTKIGTSTSQKLGFFNKTPVVQPAAVADATDAASAITQLNAVLARLRSLGLIAT